MDKWLEDIFPIMGVEHDCVLSKQGDVTAGYRVQLPELFTLSDGEYEAFHQAWVKAIKVLPKHSILHKQDWFIDRKYKADFNKEDQSFLSRSSERFFNERPYLDHSCYIILTKKPNGRKAGSSLFSNLLRKSIVPEQTLKGQMLQDFLGACGQFKQIMEDSGFVKMQRLQDADFYSEKRKMGIIERYMYLSGEPGQFIVKDTRFNRD